MPWRWLSQSNNPDDLGPGLVYVIYLLDGTAYALGEKLRYLGRRFTGGNTWLKFRALNGSMDASLLESNFTVNGWSFRHLVDLDDEEDIPV